jgi:hypothetical protein
MVIKRKIISATIAVFLAVSLALLLACSIVQGQETNQLTPSDTFPIPVDNGSISFDVAGSYQQASLENDTWHFVNLQLTNSTPLENFRVSAKNSNMTIRSYLAYNNTIVGIRLRCVVEGQGIQSFNWGFVPKGGDWGITFNGNFMGQDEGWHVSKDGTITLTKAVGNVTINYYTIPDSLGGSSNIQNQSFYQQHSVVLTIAAVVAVAIILVTIISLNSKNKNSKLHNSPKDLPSCNIK